jgi:hypothetical protein
VPLATLPAWLDPRVKPNDDVLEACSAHLLYEIEMFGSSGDVLATFWIGESSAAVRMLENARVGVVGSPPSESALVFL